MSFCLSKCLINQKVKFWSRAEEFVVGHVVLCPKSVKNCVGARNGIT